MHNKIHIFFVIVFVIIFNSVRAIGTDYIFSNLSVENGLSNNQVNAICKDSKGFVWVGTLWGLDRFDGIEVRSYADKFPSPIENILSIIEDANSDLWVGASNGLYKYIKSEDCFVVVSLGEGVVVNVIEPVVSGTLLIGTNKGVFLLNTIDLDYKHILMSESETSKTNVISDIWSDNHGNCWLSTLNGLAEISLEKDCAPILYFIDDPSNEGLNSFTSLCNVRNKIYLGTSKTGVFEFDINNKSFNKSTLIGNALVTKIKSDELETLYIGTNGQGLFVVNLRTNEINNLQKNEHDQASLSSSSIYSLFLDESKRLWVGTYSGGLNYSNYVTEGFHLHPITANSQLANRSIRSFYFAPDGNQFFGTRSGFIHLDKNGDVHVFTIDNTNENLRSNIILAIHPFRNKILIGTYGGGLSIYDPTTHKISSFDNSSSFKNDNNYAFVDDINGHLWMASFDGIYRYSYANHELINYNTDNSDLECDQVFSLTFDSKNRLWVGTNSGFSVFALQDDDLIKIPLPDTYSKAYKINSIKEDLIGNIWICTEIGGLFMISDDLSVVKLYKEKDGLPDNSVCAIIEYKPGEYWISTLKGFCHFYVKEDRFEYYSISDGLPGIVFTPSAVYLDNNGCLWFGNEKGLIGFYPEEVKNKRMASHIVITNLYVTGQDMDFGKQSILDKPIEYLDTIEIKYHSSSVGFRFVDLNYLSPYDNNYFVKLEGYDTQWSDNGSKNTVYYDRLKPGRYTLKIKNTVSIGNSDEGEKELFIVVKKSITRSFFFWAVLIVVFACLLFLLMRYLLQLLRVQKEYNKQQNNEKYHNSTLSREDEAHIVARLNKFIKEEKPYLNPDIKLHDVSEHLGIPAHHISQSLNQVLDQNFSDFINKYRVREVRYMLENDVNRKLTLLAIADQCGFNSKTSFYRVFKKFTGKTPAEYLKML